MALIHENKNFFVESFEKPHVSREEGGHIKISMKQAVVDRTKLTKEQAIEYIKLSMVVGKAFKESMIMQGIEIMRINYQDMGNWAFKKNKQPEFHVHLYGRAKNAVKQPYKEAVYLPDRSSGFYDQFVPLTELDCNLIKKNILKNEKELE